MTEEMKTKEDLRHEQLMNFMATFKNSMEENMKVTNDKLDTKIDKICVDMEAMNCKIDANDDKSKDVLQIMDKRLNQLETEMRRSSEQMDRRQELRRKEAEAVAKKMKHLVGLGPIQDTSIDHFFARTRDRHQALILAVKEYMVYFLAYDEEELADHKFLEAKRAGKGNVIYVALEDEKQVKEIHFRRAASENENLTVRDYIPPQYFSRYKAISAKAHEKRMENPKLKTQIRWGDHDLEIHTKLKDLEEQKVKEQFRKENLREFMGESTLPDFDTRIKWTKKDENKPRRELNFGERSPCLPSLGNRTKAMIRQLSSDSNAEVRKKQRQDHEKSRSDMDASTSSQAEATDKE